MTHYSNTGNPVDFPREPREFYNTFEDWFEEIENYGQRSERFYGELPNDIALSDTMILWLRAAFECGQSGPQRQLDMLAEGINIMLPRSREHALAMMRVAMFYLEHNKENSQ